MKDRFWENKRRPSLNHSLLGKYLIKQAGNIAKFAYIPHGDFGVKKSKIHCRCITHFSHLMDPPNLDLFL